jgi:hypothetical protein
MQTLKAILDKDLQSGITRRKKKSQGINKRDLLFIIKYANLCPNHRLIQKTSNAQGMPTTSSGYGPILCLVATVIYKRNCWQTNNGKYFGESLMQILAPESVIAQQGSR